MSDNTEVHRGRSQERDSPIRNQRQRMAALGSFCARKTGCTARTRWQLARTGFGNGAAKCPRCLRPPGTIAEHLGGGIAAHYRNHTLR